MTYRRLGGRSSCQANTLPICSETQAGRNPKRIVPAKERQRRAKLSPRPTAPQCRSMANSRQRFEPIRRRTL